MKGDYPIVRRPPATFYHGGVAGLAVGDFVLPAGQVDGVEDDHWYDAGGHNWYCFVTTDIMQAWHNVLLCESQRGAGAVYRVDPVGRLRLDLCETGTNFAVRSACILALVHIPEWARAAYKSDPYTWGEQWAAASGFGGD